MASEVESNHNQSNYPSRLYSQSPYQTQDSFQRYSYRNAAMNSIHRGIKHNDASMIIGSGNKTFLPSIGGKNDDEQIFDERRQVHNSLAQTRKKYDDLQNQTATKEKELQRLKEENQKLQQFEQTMAPGSENALEFEKELDQQKQSSKIQFQQSMWTQQSYIHIRERLKRDQISYEIKTNQIKGSLEGTKTSLQSADVYSNTTKQYNAQTQKVLDDMVKNIEMEHQTREDELAHFKNEIKSKQELDRKRDDRLRKQQEIAEQAMNDKESNQKKWTKLLYVHQFVSTMLKAKMQREMQQFNTVETAYQKIKTATGVTESQDIINQFLTREQTYGELLATIAESEQKIENLQRRHQINNHKLHNLKEELVSMEMQQKKSKNVQEIEFMKSLQNIEQKTKKVRLLRQQMYQWCIKFLFKYDRVIQSKNNQNNYYEIYPREKLPELFKYVSDTIQKELDVAHDQDIERVLDEIEMQDQQKELAPQEYVRRNIRIRPNLSQRESSHHSRDSSKDSKSSATNSHGESESETGINDDLEFDHFKGIRDQLQRQEDLVIKKNKIQKEQQQDKLKKAASPEKAK